MTEASSVDLAAPSADPLDRAARPAGFHASSPTRRFSPVFEAALAAHDREIEAIAAIPDAPTIDNTLAALELSGEALSHVSSIFWLRAGAHTNDLIQSVERDIAPKMARHYSAISMNPALFARIDALYAAARRPRPRRRDAAGAGTQLEGLCPLGRQARRGRQDTAWRDQRGACRRSARSSARTCWPTRRSGRCSSTRATLPACPTSSRARWRRRPRRVARRAATR